MGTTAAVRVPDQQDVPDSGTRILDPSEIAEFVRARREANGWAQETLAMLSGLSIRTIQRVEDGQPSSVDTRRALARAFQFPDVDFFAKPMPMPDELQIRRLIDECQRLQTEKEQIQERMAHLNQQTETTQMMLNMAAARDARWLHMVRTTLMPKQPGRVPFHNAAEIAIRGYHCSMRGKPILKHVTWSPLLHNENGLHRGYHAGLIFTGADFMPGITWASRPEGSSEEPGQTSWRQPNIYFGEYLEMSVHPDPEEGPLGWRKMEFALRSPEGQISDWVGFTYQFDDEQLLASMRRHADQGARLLEDNLAGEAVEPLRRAWSLSRGLLDPSSEERARYETIWNRAIDQSMLDKLRFREGAQLRIVAGPHEGKTGSVERLLLRHVHAYLIDVGVEKVQASGQEVEAV